MSEIDWSKVTQPFKRDRRGERWITHGTINVKTLEDGRVEVTNETLNVTATANSFEEALSECNNKVQEEFTSGKAFIGRSNF